MPAHLSYMFLMHVQGRNLELRAEYDRDRTRGRMARCLSVIAWGLSSHDVPEAGSRYRELLRAQGRTPCTEIARAWAAGEGTPRADLLLQAYRRYGGGPHLADAYAGAALAAGHHRPGLDLLRVEIAAAPTSALAFSYHMALHRHLSAAGDTTASAAEVTRITRRFAGDKRAIVQWHLFGMQRDARGSDTDHRRQYATAAAAMISLARSHRAAGFEFEATLGNAVWNIEHGDLLRAVGILNDAVALAEAAHSPDMRLLAYLQRGRARAAQGRQTEAITDLLTAARAARLLGERYRLADTYHHMAHAYEARADWPAAIAAADSFVKIGAGVRDRSMRMVRLHDAGAIHWKAGFHARANELYREMVRTIDRDSVNYEYAGAYFERIGDLGRAVQYYRRAYAGGSATNSQKLTHAGLARVYEELGLLDSAIASARRHDAAVTTPEREILLPRLLARHGNVRQAIALADRWAAEQFRRGNPAAYAAAVNQQAELVLPSDPGRALMLAGKADSIARGVNVISEMVTARRLRGLAKAKLGNADGGVRDLLAALSSSEADQSVFLPVTLKTDIADVWAGAARPERALSWYAAADEGLEAVGHDLDDPVMLARFRAARRTIFDGAIRTALTLPPASRTLRILEWSERKKGSAPHAITAQPRLTDGNRAIIDYLSVGDTILATVITKAGARVLLLPISPRTAADRATALLRPLREIRGGRIDIGRAAYSMGAAKVLYDGLLGAVEGAIGSAANLVVVPDVPLQAIPFDALVARHPAASTPQQSYTRAVYAADRWVITFAPTVRATLTQPSAGTLANRGVLLVSHIAPGSDRERKEIRGAWPATKLRELDGRRATEREIRNGVDWPIIHFATHSVSDDGDPLRSHLVLEAGGSDDGLLHASEIRRLKWSRTLVFLSACETAAGPMFSGTGTLSLARAFFDGGASTVIATQWPVGAISADISRGFYRELANGVAAPTALHRAKLAIRNNPATSHPFFWASHILISGPTRSPPAASTR